MPRKHDSASRKSKLGLIAEEVAAQEKKDEDDAVSVASEDVKQTFMDDALNAASAASEGTMHAYVDISKDEAESVAASSAYSSAVPSPSVGSAAPSPGVAELHDLNARLSATAAQAAAKPPVVNPTEDPHFLYFRRRGGH